jgi:RHS repeat-associated protein
LPALAHRPDRDLSPRKHRGYRHLVRRRSWGRSHQNTLRDYDPTTGGYDESDPAGLVGGMSTYSYASDGPVAHSDPTGLFSLNVNDSWSQGEIPGNHWWNWLPGFGGNRLGLTLAYAPDAQCRCINCGGSWTVSECSAALNVKVMIESGLNPAANSFARGAEGEHVADVRAGAGIIQRAGAAAEKAQQQQKYSSQDACELQGSRAVTAAVRAARDSVVKASSVRDTNGSHTYHGVWPF